MRNSLFAASRVSASPLALAISILLCGATGCRPALEPEQSPGSEKPTPPPEIILLISLDTLRADHLGMYGHHRPTSPVLDRFAAGGTIFEDASSTAPWTLPAHASMLTGLYPINHRVLTFATGLPGSIPTLAGELREAGYRTAAVVNSAWLKKERYGVTRDFEKYLFVDDTQDRRAPNTWITDQAISWLEEDAPGPLFLFVHYYDVHSDYSSLPEYERLFVSPYTGEADGTGWQLARASLETDYLEMCRQNYDPAKCRIGTVEKYLVIDESLETIVFDAADLQHVEELYDAGIRQLDNELSRLFSALGVQDLLDKTLIVITSDHGEEFQDHGRLDHFLTMYQEVLRVPLIFRGPNVPAGLRIKTPVSLVDLAPTVLSLAGLPDKLTSDGFDLSPLLDGEVPNHFSTRSLFGEASGGLTHALMMDDIFPVYRSIRQGSHKLIHNSKTDSWALYDLSADPLETLNLVDQKPQIVEDLASLMRDRYEDFDPTPLPSDRVELDAQELEHLRALGYLP